MGKFIFWIVIIFAALLVLRLINLRQHKKKTPKGAAMGRPAEAMVRCAHCGVYLPRSEALLVDGTLRCHDKDCS